MRMDEIVITVVGCGDAFASGGRLHTCFYIEAPHTKLLLDCGATAYYGLKKQGIEISEIDTVVISHFHGDHYGGVPFLLLEEAVRGRDKPLTIISPPTGREQITQLLDHLYPATGALSKLNILFKTYVADGILETDHFELSAYAVDHTPATRPHGVRIQIGGKTISFSGDTAWTPVLLELARDADLFICETNFFSSNISGHLSYRTLCAHDDQLAYKKILLTHFGTEMLARLDQVSHPCAVDGQRLFL